MYTQEDLQAQLVVKLEKEQEEYLKQMRSEGVDVVIENIYEINARQEILDYISYKDYDPKELEALLKTDNILTKLYNEWLKYDGNFYEILEDPVDREIGRISDDYYSKDNKDIEQKSKVFIGKNKELER